ncbi:MAG: CbbQ/NirQ/NorQ C-terminal domain-containing protein [Candidatus Thiodiazotropha sp. L084R]
MTRTAGALIGRRRSSAFWGLGCPKTHHEIKDSLDLLKGMKPSTRQRFVALRFEFPSPDLEIEIVIGETGIDTEMAKQLVRLANSMRALKDHDLEEAASSRLLVYAATLILGGYQPIEACRAALVEPLTDDIETAAALMEVVYASIGH